jgi:hypothetical protein
MIPYIAQGSKCAPTGGSVVLLQVNRSFSELARSARRAARQTSSGCGLLAPVGRGLCIDHQPPSSHSYFEVQVLPWTVWGFLHTPLSLIRSLTDEAVAARPVSPGPGLPGSCCARGQFRATVGASLGEYCSPSSVPSVALGFWGMDRNRPPKAKSSEVLGRPILRIQGSPLLAGQCRAGPVRTKAGPVLRVKATLFLPNNGLLTTPSQASASSFERGHPVSF